MGTRSIAALGALLTLVVVVASAAIRIGADEPASTIALIRGVHRAAASLAALLVLALLWRGLRTRESRIACVVAFVLMSALSVVGWATGTHPPRPAALFNQLGGITLASLLAWIAGHAMRDSRGQSAQRALAHAALCVAALQGLLGAALAALGATAMPPIVVLHAVLGTATAALAAALCVRLPWHSARDFALLACAFLAPLAGVAATLPGAGLWPQIGHAAAAALLLATLSFEHGALTRSA